MVLVGTIIPFNVEHSNLTHEIELAVAAVVVHNALYYLSF